jgi:hypothetical protein
MWCELVFSKREHRMKKPIKEELLDQLLEDYSSPEDLIGPEGLLTQLKKRLINKVLDAELTTHLGFDQHAAKPGANARNGHSNKTLRSDDGEIEVNAIWVMSRFVSYSRRNEDRLMPARFRMNQQNTADPHWEPLENTSRLR